MTLSNDALEARRKYQREYAKKYFEKNPEKRKESNRKYWENRAKKLVEQYNAENDIESSGQEVLMNRINVLDKGYVILHDTLGSDLTVANAARVSYDKRKETLDEKDERLISFLAKHDHTSPFRHATLQFEVYAPLMIARQWWKYVVGSDHIMDAWNESSRRYVTEQPEFYIPAIDQWRSAPDNKKQGSGDLVIKRNGLAADSASTALKHYVANGIELYEEAMKLGICAEQARLFLPAYAMYVRWYWTASLQSVAHLIRQRTKPEAQFEFQEYANAVQELSQSCFPVALKNLLEKSD